MPSTEAQKRAAKNWRARNPEPQKIFKKMWLETNHDKHLEYARKSMAKNYLWKCAVRDLMRCLL